jgi:hypothetical protein
LVVLGTEACQSIQYPQSMMEAVGIEPTGWISKGHSREPAAPANKDALGSHRGRLLRRLAWLRARALAQRPSSVRMIFGRKLGGRCA